MKHYLKILLPVLFPLMVHAQQDYPDSLRQALKMATTDSAKYSITKSLFTHYTNDNVDSALGYIDQCLLIAKKNNHKINEADCLQNIGWLLPELGKYAESFNSFQEAFKIAEDSANESMAWKLDNKMSLHQNRLLVLGWTHLHFGASGGYTNNTDQQIFQFNRALQLGEEIGDTFLTGIANVGLADTYFSFNKLDSALTLYKKVEQMFQGTGYYYEKYRGDIYFREGDIYKSKGDKNRQLYYYHKGLDALSGHGQNNKGGLSQGYWALADYFLQEKEKDSSLYYSKKNVEVLNSIGAPNIGWAYLQLSKSYVLRNEKDSASKYLDLGLTGVDGNYKAEIKNQSEFQKQSFKDQMRVKELEQEKKDATAIQELEKQKLARNGFMGGFAVVIVFAGVFFTQRNRIQKGKKLSDELLLNILPEETAEELKSTGSAEAKSFDEVTVMFTDFKNFTQASEKMNAKELVSEINYLFSEFDKIISKHNIEKIKTIGDSYMCAGGLPVANKTNATDVVNAALEIQNFMNQLKEQRAKENRYSFEIRIGIHSGPVVAGIVGIKKFAYDIWGDTVNIASRMESSGEAGKVNISGVTYELVKDKFICVHRGKIAAKNKGEVDMYFVEHQN